jgi:hypothetical protein
MHINMRKEYGSMCMVMMIHKETYGGAMPMINRSSLLRFISYPAGIFSMWTAMSASNLHHQLSYQVPDPSLGGGSAAEKKWCILTNDRTGLSAKAPRARACTFRFKSHSKRSRVVLPKSTCLILIPTFVLIQEALQALRACPCIVHRAVLVRQ